MNHHVFDPAAPTSFPPGSKGKLRILRLRAKLGLPLFVEGDGLGPLPTSVALARQGYHKAHSRLARSAALPAPAPALAELGPAALAQAV
jgi:hypothetical protein